MRSNFFVSLLAGAALTLTSCNIGTSAQPTVDVNALNTAIVETTVAQLSVQFTQTSQAAPADTNTPEPTNTAASLPSLPTIDLSGAPTATIDVAALPTFSFVNTPVTSVSTPLPGITPLVTPIATLASGAGQPSTANGCNDAQYISDTPEDGTVVTAGDKFTHAWQLQNTGTCNWDEGYTFAFLPDVSSSAIIGYDITIKATDTVTEPGHSQSFVVKLTAPTAAGEYKAYWRMKDDAGNFFGSRVYLDIVVK